MSLVSAIFQTYPDSFQVRSTFAKLSKDIVQFFNVRRIKPKQATHNALGAQSDLNQNGSSNHIEDPLKSAENDNWLNFVKDATSFCPTCGSNATTPSAMPDVTI